MGAIIDFKSEMKAIEKISELSRKAVDTSRNTFGDRRMHAAVVAGAIALATVMQDAHAMSYLDAHSVVSETILNISSSFDCEGHENSLITLAALDGMSTCAAALGVHAETMDMDMAQVNLAYGNHTAIDMSQINGAFDDQGGPVDMDEVNRAFAEHAGVSEDMSDDMFRQVRDLASSAWGAVTENGAFKTAIEAITAFAALVEAIKFVRGVIEKTIGRAPREPVSRRREPTLDDSDMQP